MIAYMFWYTLKDDMIGFPFALLGSVCRKGKESEVADVDKGYFGIMTCFVQAATMMRLAIANNSSNISTQDIQEIEQYIGLLLSKEVTYFSRSICPYRGINYTEKLMFKFGFLIGIYLSWLAVFILFLFLSKLLKKAGKGRYPKSLFWTLKLKFIKGFVEIIKYTYGGFTSIVFISLTCISMETNYV